MPFEPAAAILTRVVSNPSPNIYCFDLGHKAIGSEMQVPSAFFPDLPEIQIKGQSEEHLMVEYHQKELQIGDVHYAIPQHICPTVALHQKALVISDHRVVDQWQIVRNRHYLL
jgi:D-serine deaminase-like pyridoxal phosphate-dependent protein